jgi:hypothetical protein
MPTKSSWLNRVEAQFTALRDFALVGTDHASHTEQANMSRRYIIWRNNHAYDERLRRMVEPELPCAGAAGGGGTWHVHGLRSLAAVRPFG